MCEWVSVKDRLPKYKTDILMYVPRDDSVEAGYYMKNVNVLMVDGSTKRMDRFDADGEVTHWMYYPKGPE